jgi:hypothetical protein
MINLFAVAKPITAILALIALIVWGIFHGNTHH